MTTSNWRNEQAKGKQPSSVPSAAWLSLSIILFILGLFLAAGFGAISYTQNDRMLLPIAIFYGLMAAFSGIAISTARTRNIPLSQINLVNFFFASAGLLQAAIVKGTGLPSALIFLVYLLIFTSLLSNSRGGTTSILFGLVIVAGMSLLGVFSPYALQDYAIIQIVLWVIFVVALGVYSILQFRQTIYLTLQIRLITAFIAIVVVSISIGTLVQNQVTIRELESNTSNNVVITAEQVAVSLDKFLDTTVKAVQQEALLDPLYLLLEAREQGRVGENEIQEVKTIFRLLQVRETSERVYLSSYALLDSNGTNVYDSTESNIGLSEGNQAYFRNAFASGKPYVSGVTFSDSGYSYIYFSAPVHNLKRETIGVLRVRYNALVFQRLLETYSGLLGINSHAVLFDDYNIRLGDTYTPDLVYATITQLDSEQTAQLNAEGRLPTRPDMQKSADQPGLAVALKNSDRSPSFREDLDPIDPNGARSLVEIGGIAKMAQKPWKVVYLQTNFDDTSIREGQIRIATLIATLISVLVGFLSVGLSNILSAPIKNLTATAENISNGVLTAHAKVEGNDEFGTLGRAFNQMTAQLRSFINELEDRVNQRTREIARQNENLTFRSRQLQTVAEVARSIVTSQDLLPLLNSVTNLISERFDFYHVGIFLIDPTRQYAVLRAANSEGGRRMLERQHRLGVGKTGIVGYVTGSGRARIATDVGEDSVFFNNPDLPTTRSEMALPLMVGNEIIGALDVQSTESNAFTSDDIDLFSTLADQVAIAIYNNRLYTETVAALAESQNLHRQYLRQEWGRDLKARRTRAIQFTPQGVIAQEASLDGIESTLHTGEPMITSEELPDHSLRSVMAVPIIVRGEPIGVIRLQDNAENRSWNDEEIAAVQEVSQQVSVALEAARLLEQTVHRAEREKKVLEITGMIRSTNDPQQMLEIAASELQKALGASRAQIFIRKGTKPLSGPPNGENGHKNNGSGASNHWEEKE